MSSTLPATVPHVVLHRPSILPTSPLPGCRLAFIEHVVAPPSRPLLRAVQGLLNPVFRELADGCTLTRDTLGSLRAAGFSELDVKQFDLAAVPHIAGIARV